MVMDNNKGAKQLNVEIFVYSNLPKENKQLTRTSERTQSLEQQKQNKMR